MKKIDKSLLFMLLVFGIYGAVGVLSSESVTAILGRIVVMTLFALSFNLQYGYSGMVSLGHSLFFGMGGYVLVLIMSHYGIALIPALLMTLLICFVLTVFVGIICLKNSMEAFTFLSYGIALAALTAVGKWVWAGSTVGVTYQALPEFLTGYRTIYAIIWTVCLLCCVAIYLIVQSPFGMLMQGVRENEERLTFLGIHTNRLRLVIFTVSCMFAAIAGILYAFRNAGAYTASLDTSLSFQAVIMCVLGGSTYFAGPIIGAFIIPFIYNYISTVFPYYEGLMGLMILLTVYLLQKGLVSLVATLKERYRREEGAE